MKLFRKDAAAGLRKAQDALAAAEAKITALEDARRLALAESDTTEPVLAADRALGEARVEASIHRDRIATLKATVAEEQAAERQAKYAAAIVVVEKKLEKEAVERGRRIERLVRELGEEWNALIGWAQTILSDWSEELPLPSTADLQGLRDLRGMRREFAVALHAAGKPAWNRPCSIPAPVGPIAVQGLQPVGLAKYIENTGRAFIARLRMQQPVVNSDEGNEAA